MTNFHFQANVTQRSKGCSSVAAAAYRAGEKLQDDRTGRVFDYTFKKDVDATFLIGWTGYREALWNAAEVAEKRKDSTVAREYVVALPKELTVLQRQELAITLAKKIHALYGVAVDLCIHGVNSKNPHAHLLTTTREVCHVYYELGPKSIVDKSHSYLKEMKLPRIKDQLNLLKEYWCRIVNNELRLNNFKYEISHLSFKEKGINNRKPQIKTYGNPKRVAVNDLIKEYNDLMEEIETLSHEIYLAERKQGQEYQQDLEQTESPIPAPEKSYQPDYDMPKDLGLTPESTNKLQLDHYTLEKLEPASDPINNLQLDYDPFKDYDDEIFSDTERLTAKLEAEYAAEDAAIEEEKARASILSSRFKNRNNGPGF